MQVLNFVSSAQLMTSGYHSRFRHQLFLSLKKKKMHAFSSTMLNLQAVKGIGHGSYMIKVIPDPEDT